MGKLGGLELLFADAALRIKLPNLCSHIKDVGIPRHDAGCLGGDLSDNELVTRSCHPVQPAGVIRGRSGNVVESGGYATLQTEESREVGQELGRLVALDLAVLDWLLAEICTCSVPSERRYCALSLHLRSSSSTVL